MDDGNVLRKYLNVLREFDNPFLLNPELEDFVQRSKIKIDEKSYRANVLFSHYNNWAILLYGNRKELFEKVNSAFENSGFERKDSFLEKWVLHCDLKRQDPDGTFEDPPYRVKIFNLKKGTVRARLVESTHGMYMSPEDMINGEYHSLFLMLHPNNYEHEMEGTENFFPAMKIAIMDIGKYLLRNKITSRFEKENINYIPK